MGVHKYHRTGRWVAQFYDATTGKRIQVGTFDTQREAKAALAEYGRQRELDAGTGDMTVAEWRERWLENPDWRASTRKHNEERTRWLLDAGLGGLPLREFGISLAKRVVREEPHRANAISAMFGAACREVDDKDRPLAMFNPFTKVKVRRPVYRRDLPDEWMTAADVDAIEAMAARMFGAYGQDCAAIWRFAAETGIRPGELYTLEEADLNVADGELTIRRAADSKMRIVGPPKTGESRIVVLSDRAAEAAASARRHAGDRGLNPVFVDRRGATAPWSGRGTPRLFSSPEGKQLWTGSWHYYWRQIRGACGRPGMDFYEARHYCATRLIEMGLTYDDVAHQLGHADARLVATTYGHPSARLARERVRAAMNAA